MLTSLQKSKYALFNSPTACVILMFVFLAIVSCSREKTSDENDQTDTTTVQEISFVITEEGVGPFSLGSIIPEELNNSHMKLVRTTVLINSEGEQFEEPWYVLSVDGDEVLRILPDYDPEEEEYSRHIDEIRIISPVCTTSANIHVGSSLNDLAATYRSLTLWYSYVSDMFVAEVDELPGVQFHLDEKGFIGSHDDLMDSDMVFLSRTDFRPETTIRTIRILGEI